MVDPKSLDLDDTLRFDCIVGALFQNFETSFAQWSRQALSDGDWVKWEILIRQYMAQPGVQQYWSRSAVSLNPAFRAYVEALQPSEIYSYTSKEPAAQKGDEVGR